jgi:hypothetical protein
MKTTGSVLLATSLCLAQPRVSRILDIAGEEANPQQAMTWMQGVWARDRGFTFSGFAQTATYVSATMREIGLQDVETLAVPADGTSQFGFWTMPLAWDAEQATLEIVNDPGPLLADYQRWPTSLCMWSGPTPPEGITAEVIEYRPGSDMRGKFVLTSVNAANLKDELVRAGAAGAINGFSENRDLADGRQWINAWGDFGWAFTRRSTPMPCFSITPRQADALRKRLPARVHARVRSRYYQGTYPSVTGVIRGTKSKEEVLTLGHAYEQGAQDNATGVGAMLEAMATLERLMRSRRLPRPERSIRILVMGEMYGTHHYIATHPDRVRRTVGAFCVDTPAAPYELPGTHYTFHLNPHAGAAYTDALILELARTYFEPRQRRWEWKEFTPGTDSFLGEPSIGIPTTWAYSGTGVHTHHNSEDTADKVDVRSMRDLVTINAAYLYLLANAGPDEVPWLAGAIRRHFSGIRAQVALNSLRRLDPQWPVKPVATAVAPSGELPRRLRFGTIPLDDLAPDQREGFPNGAWVRGPTLALYWADGKRTIPEIVYLTEQEAGTSSFDYAGYFRFLARKGYIELRGQAGSTSAR